MAGVPEVPAEVPVPVLPIVRLAGFFQRSVCAQFWKSLDRHFISDFEKDIFTLFLPLIHSPNQNQTSLFGLLLTTDTVPIELNKLQNYKITKIPHDTS